MAYNRWLSGSQQYQSNDVLHYGRLGMKWGKHIFGIPESLFQKLKIGPGTDIKSLQTLLQRGEIDFNTFKQLTNRQNMFNQIVNRGRSTGFTDNTPTTKESPTHETVRRSGQQMKDIGESVKKDVEERSAREEKYRKIAENKAMQGRQDEFQVQQRQKAEAAKKKEELDRAHANSRRTSTSQPKSQPETEKTSTSQPKTQPENQQPTDEELEENLYRALSNYLTGTTDETEEEKKKREAEEAKKKAEEEKKRKEEEERKKREKTEKEVKILKKICKYLNFGRIPIHP